MRGFRKNRSQEQALTDHQEAVNIMHAVIRDVGWYGSPDAMRRIRMTVLIARGVRVTVGLRYWHSAAAVIGWGFKTGEVVSLRTRYVIIERDTEEHGVHRVKVQYADIVSVA